MTCFTSSVVKARRVYMEDAQQTVERCSWTYLQVDRPLVINRTNSTIQYSCLFVQEKG